jgi:methanethiol S-methyltransferase
MMQWFSALIISVFFVVYAVVHSLLASFAVKGWARRVFGPGVDRWYRLIYNLLAVVTVLPILHIVDRLPTEMLYVVPSPWRWLMTGGQVLALTGLVASLLQTGLLHFLGLAQLLAWRPVESSTLAVRGFYGWVRHPLYTFSMLYLWLTPAMTTNLLTVFILFTLYFYIGSIHEERRLLAEFGDAYQLYQRRVPRLIPINCGSKNWVRQIVKGIVLLAFYSGRFPAINYNGRVNSADSRGATPG